jgi:Domain of unknown function (DUF4390)
MVFFMRTYSSINQAALLAITLIINLPVAAGDVEVKISHAETVLVDGNYAVNADIDYRLSKVEERRDYVWNKTIVDKTARFRIQYHALLNMYRVKNESDATVNNFSTLQAALDLLSTLRDYPLVEQKLIQAQKHYVAKMKVHFERDALPLPLRPTAYLNPQWYLSSAWYVWPLKK